MVRLVTLMAMLGALHFGGMSLLSQEAHAVANDVHSAHAKIDTVATNFNAGVAALHNATSSLSQVNSGG